MARFIGIDPGAVSRLVDRLAGKGLMTRSADPASRRRLQLGLTGAGRALVPDLIRIADENDELFFGALPPEERTGLMRLLQGMLPALSAVPPAAKEASMTESAPARSITKSITIDRPPGEVFDYLADTRNWPRWSVVNVLAIEATSDPSWWKMTTPRGVGELRIRGDAATGLVDHDFRDPQTAWTVPARVVPNGRGAEFLITFFRPAVLDDDEFDRQAALVDTELATLKGILENKRDKR